MLGDKKTRSRGGNGCRRGNVDALSAVPAGTDDFADREALGTRDGERGTPHRCRGTRDFFGFFAPHFERGENACERNGGNLAFKNCFKERAAFAFGESFAFVNAFDDGVHDGVLGCK